MSKKKKQRKKITPKSGSQNPNRKIVRTESVKETEIIQEEPVINRAKTASQAANKLPFERMNYILLVIGIALIAFGFFLMSLNEFVDATEFSVSLHIAPVVVVIGFLEIIYAIMYQPKSSVDG